MGKFFPFTTWGSFPYNTVNEGRADIMNKQEIYAFLKEKNLDFEITEHPAVYSMEELAQVALPYPEADAKNLFVRDDKKRNYYLITVKGDKRVDLKKFQKKHGTRRLSFASADDLMAIMGLVPGAVTPLGVLNDEGALEDEDKPAKLFGASSFTIDISNPKFRYDGNTNTVTVTPGDHTTTGAMR